MSAFQKGLHQNLDLKGFLTSEKKIIETYLAKEWLLTRAGTVTFGHSNYRYLIAKPTKIYSDLFNLIREFVILFSPFPEFQPRTIDAIEKIHKSFPNLRLEKVCSVIISKSPNIESELKSILLSDPEAQIIIPFSYDEFNNILYEKYIQDKFKEHFFKRDLFAFQAELKKDLFFFGRNELVHKLVAKHKSNENSGLFGLRKTGKTSILHGVRRVLANDDMLSVIINCQSPDFNLKNWNIALNYIIKQIKNQNQITLKVRDENHYIPSHAVESFESDLNKILRKTGSKNILIIFDEIEHITYEVSHIEHWKNGHDFLTFWQALRALFQKEYCPLTFLIAGTNPKCIEFTTIDGTDNPIFELISRDSFVPGFSVKQIEEMVSYLGKIMGLSFDDTIYAKLKEDFGGHPFLIRQVCSIVHKNITTTRPARVDKTIYDKAKAYFYKNNHAYNQMILDVLKEFYNDEYQMLEFLALDDIDTFNDFARISPLYTTHLLGYGIIDENNGGYSFNIESIKAYLADKKRYKRINLSKEEKLKETSERRNIIEPKLRKIVRTTLFAKYGESAAKKIVLEIFGEPRKTKLMDLKYRDLFESKDTLIYFTDLTKLIEKDWPIFENIFDRKKDEFSHNMNIVNKYRIDAHAKEITDDELAIFRISISKLEEQIDKFQ